MKEMVKIQSFDNMLRDAFVILRSKGMTMQEIADFLEISKTSLVTRCKRWEEEGNCVRGSNRGRSLALRTLTVDAYTAIKRSNPFLKEKDIADLLGVSCPTLRKWKKEQGLGKGKGAWVGK